MTRREVLALQQSLNGSGYAYQLTGGPLVEDGIYGPATEQVHRAWQDQHTRIPTLTPAPAKPWWQSRAVLGLLASLLAMIAGRMGWSIDDGQITEILLRIAEVGGLAVAAWGTIRRQAPIDPTLVARVGARDVRLPVRPDRARQPDDDPRGVFRDY